MGQRYGMYPYTLYGLSATDTSQNLLIIALLCLLRYLLVYQFGLHGLEPV